MESVEMNLFRKSNFTKNYIKLINNLNTKLDDKINDITNRIVEDFEKKKKELLTLKEQLDEYNKIKNEISGLNNFYELAQTKDRNLLIETISNSNVDPNHYKTNKNILSILDSVNITVQNGDLLRKCFKTNTMELMNANDLRNPDMILSNYSRLLVKKNNTLKSMDTNKVLLESNKTNIVIDFGDYKVKPNELSLRYFFLPNENKYTYSYVNSLLGSNDGESWELLSSMNLNDLRNFEKIPIFKYDLLNKKPIESFYRFLSLEIAGTKDIATTNQINRYFNKFHIPLCGIEVFGDYYSNTSSKLLENLDDQFEEFFDLYINKNYSELSDRSEPRFLVKMLHESYKELTNLIANYKSKLELGSIVKNVLETESAENQEDEKRIVREIKKELDALNSMTERIESELQEEVQTITENKTIKELLESESAILQNEKILPVVPNISNTSNTSHTGGSNVSKKKRK